MTGSSGKNERVRQGWGQLTMVEHALCPLDSEASLTEGMRHECEYSFGNSSLRRSARVRVDAPAGLSASDDLYLWGLLALTLAQPEASFEFYATPRYCLRQLGVITAQSNGGKNYELFRQAIHRLSAVRYQNDRFYDPIRREHRSVSFGFFSYSLPVDPTSSRAWRIVWDSMFFELSQGVGSHLKFELGLYRKLDCPSRRLFLLLKKVFWRRARSPSFDVRQLAINVLGYSPNLTTANLKAKVKRCAQVLARHEVIGVHREQCESLFDKRAKGVHVVQFPRGPYFKQPSKAKRRFQVPLDDSPLCDPLRSIGFDDRAIQRILKQFAVPLIQVWSDVTLRAVERHGTGHFRRSPEAYFMDNIKNAAAGKRTPPDWFLSDRKLEQQKLARSVREKRPTSWEPQTTNNAPGRALDQDGSFEQIVSDMTGQFRAGGQPDAIARKNAQRFAEESLKQRQSTSK